jgi:hypothetical protein
MRERRGDRVKRPARKTAKRDPLRITRTDTNWLRDYWFRITNRDIPRMKEQVEAARASGDLQLVKLREDDLYRSECNANFIKWRLDQIRNALLIERAVCDALAADAAKRKGGAS